MTAPVNNVTRDYSDLHSTVGPVINEYAKQGEQVKALSARLKAADGDRRAALQAYIDSSEEPAVVKLRNIISQSETKLMELAEKNVVSETLSDEDKNKLQTELSELRKAFGEGRKAIITIAGSMGLDVNPDSSPIVKALDEIGGGVGTRGRKPGTTGSSLPKASATLKLQSSAGGEPQTFDTFGAAAKNLGINVEQLQLAFAKAANVEHSEIASVDKPVTFTLKASVDLPGSSADWTVSTTPKARKKPGPRPGGSTK